jgi:hypothetical protein
MNTELAAIDKVQKLEDCILQMPQFDDFNIEHYQIPGVYVRAGIIPAGVVFTGKIHKHQCINIVAKGKLGIFVEGGRDILEAGTLFITHPGSKKAGIALEDTVFINVFSCPVTDLDEVERYLTFDSYDDYLEHERGLLCG